MKVSDRQQEYAQISEKDNTISNKFTQKFFHPIPRIKESKIAIENGIICSMDFT